MSFMIDDILGNTTKRSSTELKPTKDIKLKVTPNQYDDEDKENIPAPKTASIHSHVTSVVKCKNTSPLQQDRMALKRRLSTSPTPSCSSERSVSPSDDCEPRRKKVRTSFTNDQIQYLERIYTSQRYLASNNRTDLARMLNLSETQVKTWFQNRRMKEKRQIKGVEERLGGTVTSPAVSPLPVLGYPTGTEYHGYSPASSPALSPAGVPTIPVPSPAATAVFGGVPSLPAEAVSLYGQVPAPLNLSTSPLSSPTAAASFLGHQPGSYPGVSPVNFPFNPAALNMMPTTPFGHTLMAPAIL